MKTWLRDNGLTIALVLLFLGSLLGHMVSGFSHENEERLQHGQVLISFGEFLRGGAFLSTLFENWESEFLQMWTYVTLTAYLFQRGSPESKDPDAPAAQDRDPKLDENNPDAPGPVRAGGMARALYAHSLGLALMILFLASFVLHWVNSLRQASEEALEHNQPPPELLAYLGDARFWFESFQNWQSEFLSTAVLVVLAIFLRERGSPESKAVGAPHARTGTD
ncbi:DUF6766 family protein [Phenylobacterium sp.]|uniref:DUF6766 family protein n=1 Tax=Phenylobacterium sp. TaxID=1871053 RepID=UPI002BCB1411|nr:DUF6766 family protein [Phenylobacterium sp.]HVI32761.1 DUF6766 family protein [Phenylobacterium sp.]